MTGILAMDGGRAEKGGTGASFPAVARGLKGGTTPAVPGVLEPMVPGRDPIPSPPQDSCGLRPEWLRPVLIAALLKI